MLKEHIIPKSDILYLMERVKGNAKESLLMYESEYFNKGQIEKLEDEKLNADATGVMTVAVAHLNWKYTVDDDNRIWLAEYKGKDPNVIVTKIIGRRRVVGINSVIRPCKCRYGRTSEITYTSIKSIDIPEGIERLGHRAFKNCYSLERVKLPSTLKEIGVYAFDSCKRIREIFIPKSVEEIGGRAFDKCDSLITIDVDKGNKRYYSENGLLIESVNDNKNILRQIPSGKKEIIIPESVTEIDSDVLSICCKAKDITILNVNTELHDLAFRYGRDLTIHAAESSPAAKYAEKNKINFEILYD